MQNSGLDWGNVSNFKARRRPPIRSSHTTGCYNKNLVNQALLDAKYTTGWSLADLVPGWARRSPRAPTSSRTSASGMLFNYIGPGGGPGGSWGNFPVALPVRPGQRRLHELRYRRHSRRCRTTTRSHIVQVEPPGLRPGGNGRGVLRRVRHQSPLRPGAGQRLPLDVRHQAAPRASRSRVAFAMKRPIDEAVELAVARDEPGDRGRLPRSRPAPASPTPSPASTTTSTSLPRSVISHNYNDFFPDASIKYNFTKNLVGLAGYSYTVTRPSYADISGSITQDDENSSITIPNTALLPQYANNYSLTRDGLLRTGRLVRHQRLRE